MGTIVTRVCDRCNKLVPDDESFWNVAITCEPQGVYRTQFHTPTKRQQVEWCRGCVDEMGVLVGLLRAETPEQRVTLDDMIREIVRETQEGRDD